MCLQLKGEKTYYLKWKYIKTWNIYLEINIIMDFISFLLKLCALKKKYLIRIWNDKIMDF